MSWLPRKVKALSWVSLLQGAGAAVIGVAVLVLGRRLDGPSAA